MHVDTRIPMKKTCGILSTRSVHQCQGHPFPGMTRGFWLLVSVLDFLRGSFRAIFLGKTSRKNPQKKQITIFKGSFGPKSTQGYFCHELRCFHDVSPTMQVLDTTLGWRIITPPLDPYMGLVRGPLIIHIRRRMWVTLLLSSRTF